ncbi:3-oxo-behenoyl-CoA reductase [Aureococcus anophagefferens]|nr:3-oxo-behenoyl-CoA reductase [Aureococcus anophagefferens]
MAVPVFLLYILAAPTALWLAAYFLPLLYIRLRGVQDLKKKYGATWAVVTGGSTGIGRAICEELAKQGLNVVVAALPDKFLEPAVAELSAAYKGQEFVAVGVSFAPGADYLEKIKAATADKDVQIPLGKHLVNMECNATAAVAITHHFAAAMMRKGLKGCIVFTSSASAYIPNPFAIIYGATKAFMSQFAASIAVELQCKGIDVCVIHPSPVASNFYNKVEHKIDSMESFKKLAVDPSELPREIFASIGRCVLRDVGNTAVGMRLGVALLPYSALAHIIALVAPFLPDYVENDKKRGQV